MNFEVQKFCEISKFRFWLPVFLRYRLQNAQNTVSDNLVPPPLRLAPPVLLWPVFSLDQTSSLKKNLATGLCYWSSVS